MKVIKVNGKKILSGIGVVLLLLVAAGCSEAEKLSWERMKETQYRMVTGKSSSEKTKPSVKKDGQAVPDSESEQQPAAVKSNAKVDVVLFFSDQTGDYLKTENRQINMVPGLARAAVQELIKGPGSKNLSSTMPEGTTLRDINIQDGLCTVDLSQEFRDNHWGGSSGEILTVYSLVNTLTQFPTVEKVEILVEGQKIDTLAGHMDLSVPVFSNSQIVEGEK